VVGREQGWRILLSLCPSTMLFECLIKVLMRLGRGHAVHGLEDLVIYALSKALDVALEVRDTEAEKSSQMIIRVKVLHEAMWLISAWL